MLLDAPLDALEGLARCHRLLSAHGLAQRVHGIALDGRRLLTAGAYVWAVCDADDPSGALRLDRGLVRDAVLALDGRSVAFTDRDLDDDWPGRWRWTVVGLDDGQDRAFPDLGFRLGITELAARRGGWIGVVGDSRGRVVLLDAAGAREADVAVELRELRVSADGRWALLEEGSEGASLRRTEDLARVASMPASVALFASDGAHVVLIDREARVVPIASLVAGARP